MDRCALFVDAGYVLADGAMAVHGTRHRESVSWDYAGLLSFMGSIARERTGRPLLRCYWYEATVEGRRTSEHDSLADLPGLKLRLGRTRPGRREGVEGEIRRDLTTLARNNAISDALLVSAEEDLAQVVADVQDLGIRVTIVHITVGGNWTISRSLRQECDDIIEIGEGHLRPFTQLASGTEPLGSEEPYQLAVTAARALTNGHGPVVGPWASRPCRPDRTRRRPRSTPRPWWRSTSVPPSRAPSPPVSSSRAPSRAPPTPLPRREPSGPIERQSMEAARGGPSRAPGPQDPGLAAAECTESVRCLSSAGAAGRFRAATKPRSGPAPAGRASAAGWAQPADRPRAVAVRPAGHGRPVQGQAGLGGIPSAPPGAPGQQSMPGQGLGNQPGVPGQQGLGNQPGMGGGQQSMSGQPMPAAVLRRSRCRRRPRPPRAMPPQGMPPYQNGAASRAWVPAGHGRPARACPASRACRRASRACRACTRRRPRPHRRPGCRTRGCAEPTPRHRRPPTRTRTRRLRPRSAGRPRTCRPGRTSRGPTACRPRSR